MRPQLAYAAILALALAATPAAAEVVVLEADRDATLIEDPDGALALGSADSLYLGRTGQDEGEAIRRVLLHFDVASAVPKNATVERVVLTIAVAPSNPGPQDVFLHRVLADWGEGASAGFGGAGRPAEPGDATWLYTFFDEETWGRPGGRYVARESARATLGDFGFFPIEGGAKMVADVRMWAANPEHNFGWILIGDETRRRSVQVVVSRENALVPLRPRLEIEYRLPGRNGPSR